MDAGAEFDRQTLVREHITFARQIAKRFCRRRRRPWLDDDDMCGAALLGLVDAAQRFEPEHGVQFGAYSHARIKGAMVDLLRRGGGNDASHMRARIEYLERTGTPSGLRSAELLGLVHARTNTEFAGAVNAIDAVPVRVRVRMLDDDIDEVQFTYADAPCPEQSCEASSIRRYVQALIDRLPPDEQRLLRLHYFEGYSYSQLRLHFGGLSKAGLSRMHRRAVERLRQLLDDDRYRCEQRLAAQRSHEPR